MLNNNPFARITLVLLLGIATAAGAETPSWWEPDFRARLRYGLTADPEAQPFAWNKDARAPFGSTRAPFGSTRLMLDLRSGDARRGRLYVKGAAAWSDPDHGSSGVRFDVEQADYYWVVQGADSAARFESRLFARERRYFTAAMSVPMLDDDLLDAYGDKFGARLDGSYGRSLRGAFLGSVLGEEWDGSRRVAYGQAAYHGASIQGSLSYLHDHAAADTVRTHAVLGGELSALVRGFTAIVSYQQSGFRDSDLFIPRGNFDWDAGEIRDVLPVGGAFTAEGRLERVALKRWGYVDVVHSYFAAGDEFVSDLGTHRRGETGRETGLYFAAARVSLDGRLVFGRRQRTRGGLEKTDVMGASLRALLKNGTELLLRARRSKTHDLTPVTTRDEFIHAAVHRSRRKLHAGVHAMLRDQGGNGVDARAAWDTQVNVTTSMSMYVRLVTSDDLIGSNALFWRIDLRPTNFLFASLGYGRPFVGDGPYVLEDLDVGRTGAMDKVYTITVRGDF